MDKENVIHTHNEFLFNYKMKLGNLKKNWCDCKNTKNEVTQVQKNWFFFHFLVWWLASVLSVFNLFIISACVCLVAWVWHSMNVEVRWQLQRVSSLRPSSVWGLEIKLRSSGLSGEQFYPRCSLDSPCLLTFIYANLCGNVHQGQETRRVLIRGEKEALREREAEGNIPVIWT